MTKYNLYKYSIDAGYGDVAGMFIATQEDVDALIGQDVNFGEILGEYSDVSHEFRSVDIVKLDVAPLTIVDLAKHITDDDIVGTTTTICGVNPFKYLYRYFKCNSCGHIGEEYGLATYENGEVDVCPSCKSRNLSYSYKEFTDEIDDIE